MNIVIAFLIFSILIVVHELGHFLLAKKNGVFVVEFSIGMGPRIVSFMKNETRYSIKLFPIGGSCMMLGEDEVSDDDRAFGNKPLWGRISVILAGPIFNFLMAFFLSLFIIGVTGYKPAVVSDVIPDFPAYEAGLRSGDIIKKINNKNIIIYPEISDYIRFHQGQVLDVTYIRDGEKHNVSITPILSEEGYYMMGIKSGVSQKGNVLKTLGYSAYQVKYWVSVTIESILQMIRGRVSTEDIGGPVRIVGFIGEVYTDSVEAGKEATTWEGILLVLINMATISIMLNANLGVMNLLPLPALDGGRLLFLIIEGVRGKPIDRDKEGMVHLIGFAALMLLMVFIMYNDIKNLFL